MNKCLKILLFVVLSFQSISAQITFLVDQLPEDHDYSKPVYISGDFEGWSGGNADYKLHQVDAGYVITLNLSDGPIAYKFTQGSWNSVEYDANGEQRENRFYTVGKQPDTIHVKIASWTKNSSNAQRSTASKNVSVLTDNFLIPQLDRKRRIWIYLPSDYYVSDESYPVLYMQDGQNLFDKLSSYSGEWQVDETLDKLYNDKNFKLIVVGIDHGGDKRLNEYSPWNNPEYGPGEGDAYLEFITATLKPYIDKHYRTIKNATNTGIMGSSMGGLISFYAGLKYPDIFGKVGVFSPSFWYSGQSFNYAKTHSKVPNQEMYFVVGRKEGGTMVSDVNRMISLMETNGYEKTHISSKVVDEGAHNESFWRDQFEDAILYLFKSAIKPPRTFKTARIEDGDFLNVQVSDGEYHILFYNSKTVETTFIPLGEKTIDRSHAVVLQPEHPKTSFSENSESALLQTEGISVKIQKEPFNISYWYKGEEVISEKNGYRRTNDFETIQFNLTEDEVLYGTGERALPMNRRGHSLKLYNKPDYGYETHSELMNYCMPLVVSSREYALHFDNIPLGFIDLDSKQDNTLTYETISGRKTYQVVVGDSWLDMIDKYTDLTGKQPMPPRWILGNFSSRFGYHSEREVEHTIDLFKKDSIPVDVVIIDIYWFGKDIKGSMGNLSFYKDSFPDPERMIRNLKQEGVKTVLVSESFILTTSHRWKEAVKNAVLATDSLDNPGRFDFYFGNTGLIDVFKPEARQWFWNIYKDLADLGVQGVWGDLGEPEMHPSWLIHATGTADAVHNSYGHEWAKLVYEGYQKDFPDERPFILMRAGSSGSQHYGLIPWSGDVNRSWGGLQSQPAIALQMGMQGLGYMHSDLGGFAGDNLDDELYVRWLQYGVFQPVFRPHAQETVPSEPVFRSDKAKHLAKRAIELRYKLLPYNYTLAFENSRSGVPLMRPLLFEEPENNMLLTMADTYLWGADFLVSPVMESGIREVPVYFPGKSDWFDFYTGKKYMGGSTAAVNTVEGHIPVFVRGGAMIPMAKPIQNTEEYSGNTFELHYYFDESKPYGNGTLYNDDGHTSNTFEKGMYELLTFKADTEKNKMRIELNAETGKSYRSDSKHVDLVIHAMKEKPRKVKLNGKTLKFVFNSTFKTVTIPLEWNTKNSAILTLKL